MDVILQQENSGQLKGIFFVMEYMPNDLKKMLQENNPINFSE